MAGDETRKWLEHLGDEDIAFIKRFVVASGSLKDLADAYGISYPTLRLRLDRLIDKIRVLDEARHASDFERALRAKCADGKLDPETMKELLRLHRREKGVRP